MVRLLSSLHEAKRGTVGVTVALALIPLILATGAAVDFTRIEIVKRSLQSVVDGAALAGASTLALSPNSTGAIAIATDYFNKGTAPLVAVATIGNPVVSVPNSVTVTVSTTATLSYTLMSLISSGISIPVTATAEGPAYTLQVTKTGGFSSSADDSNSIYYYPVAASGTVPTSTSSMTLLFTNDKSIDPNYQTDNASPKAISIGANDSVGFALVNKTGGITGYGSNAYGAKQGSTHYFYSSLASPTSAAYSTEGTFYTGTQSTTMKNGKSTTTCSTTAITTTSTTYAALGSTTCYPHPCTTLRNKVVLENNLLVDSACSTSATAVRTCAQLQANPLDFSWNDLGGPSDDFDYNDADYRVTCVPSSDSTANQPRAVILTR